ncbi:hypothetical protein [Paracoccus pacificus]|uniref:Uncharacterized protein n=1 Tax=Paracoccus pacificus TaxID=1463598 RepID=A0ABW4R6E6_9RHOB
MADPARNAALFFTPDAYDPAGCGLNGRRMAGQSFLRGFVRNADVDAFVTVTNRSSEREQFAKIIAGESAPGKARPVRGVLMHNLRAMREIGTLYYPTPGLGHLLWARMAAGQTAYALCGITHTISTAPVMTQFFDLVTQPSEPWDAIICTSRAVKSAIEHQVGLALDYHARRFGRRPEFRPMLPVLPLGINCDDFQPAPTDGPALRKTLGIPAGDVVALVLSRMSMTEKFNPIPLYLALAEAAAQVPQCAI